MGTWTDPDFVPEKPSVQHYLHEYTYPELMEIKIPILDHAGILWAGPNRKGMNAPNPVDLWKAWQKAVQKAETRFIPAPVMDYFQRTKGFSRPPKTGEIDLKGDAITVTEPVKPKFTWSPTKLQAFETCPYQYAAKYFYQSLPYEETEATIWGSRVHEQAEKFLKGQAVTDPEAFDMVKRWCQVIEKIPGERFVEEKLSVDSSLKPCEYDDGEGRMIADVFVKQVDTIWLFDWKTGKKKDDTFQLGVYALLLAIKYPEVQKIHYRYIWVKTNEVTAGEFERKDLLTVAKDLKARINKVKECWEHDVWAQKKNGLCRNWCGVSECKHCGGGR